MQPGCDTAALADKDVQTDEEVIMNQDAADYQERLSHLGISRRQFMRFAGLMTATLALPSQYAARVAHALLTAPRPPVIWLEFQDCTGDTESLLRSSQPGIDELLLDVLSLDYHETLMAPAGADTEVSLSQTLARYPGQYITVVEGSIPTANNGIHCMIRGRTALSIVREVCSNALATIAIGNCAWEGGLAAAAPNPTGAMGVRGAVPGLSPLISLPGCPANVVNLAATINHYLTQGAWPDVDSSGRPYFAYGEELHDECERHDHYEAGRFVLAWGDEGHRQGWCLFRMGCKGKETDHNCPAVGWHDGACWPVAGGRGCASGTFWDRMTPFYAGLEYDQAWDKAAF
jgi:hydrogenase small subunit